MRKYSMFQKTLNTLAQLDPESILKHEEDFNM